MSTDIKDIREANERAKLEHETAQLNAETAAITGAVQPGMAVPQPQSVMEGWGDLVPLTDYPWNDTHFTGRAAGGYSSMQGAMLGDRRGGRHPPVVWTEDNLTAIRAAMRVLCEVNCSAKSAMLNLKNYVMGTGFSYDMKPVKGVEQEVSSGLLNTARTVLQEFLSENHWTGETEKPSREKELFERAHRDGEYFVALYHVGDGHVQVRVIEPEQVTKPADPEKVARDISTEEIDWMDRLSDWEFGVHTHEQDTEQVYGYHVRWLTDRSDTWMYFPEDRMVHCKLNVDATIKRGLSDFYPVYQILEKAAKLVLNVAEGASILSAIAYICEHAPGVDQSQIEAMRNTNAWARFNLPTLTEGSRTRMVQKIEPGTRIDVPKGQKYLASPLAQRGVGEAMVTIHQGVCRVAGTNWCMPEWMIAGSSQGVAYASSLAIESPFAKNAQSLQKDWIGNSKAVIWKAFKIAHEHGRFDEFGVSLNDLRRVLVIDIQPPIVAARDLDKETNRRKVLHDSGVLKPETWAREEGYEFDSEFYEKRIKSQTAMSQFGTAAQPQGPASTPFRQGKPQHPLAETRLQEAASLLWGDYPGIGIMEHHGPGDHPSGSPQEVHTVKGGEAKFQKIKAEKGEAAAKAAIEKEAGSDTGEVKATKTKWIGGLNENQAVTLEIASGHEPDAVNGFVINQGKMKGIVVAEIHGETLVIRPDGKSRKVPQGQLGTFKKIGESAAVTKIQGFKTISEKMPQASDMFTANLPGGVHVKMRKIRGTWRIENNDGTTRPLNVRSVSDKALIMKADEHERGLI